MPLLFNSTSGSIVATRVDGLSTFFQRAIGLLTRTSMRPDEGVWIWGCRAIHTIGMRVPIDVIFVDREQRVLRMIHGVPPNRLALACAGAQSVVELGCGALRDADLMLGDTLDLV